MKSNLKMAVKVALLGGAVAMATNATAYDKDLLDVLLSNGQINQQQYDKLMEKVGGDAKVSLKNGHLKVKSSDGEFSVQIGGRIMADYASIDDDRNPEEDGDGSEIRRARLFVKGKVFNDWAYKSQLDFAGDEVEIKDMYLQYKGWKPVAVTVGNHKMPFGLEELTSSKYITFMERSSNNDVFAVGRKNGLSVKTHGDNWTLAGALHMDGVDNNNVDQDENYGYGVRATFSPLAGKTQAIHLGAAFHHQEYEKNFSAGMYAQQRWRARPEIHTINTRPFDTRINGVEDADTFGLEAAAVFGPFSLQAEYFDKSISTDSSMIAGAKDVDFDGWYVYGSYFLTGESRAYNPKKGAFGRVKPKSVVGQGGIGAWELAVRYTDIDLYDGTMLENPAISTLGEEGDILTIGVNWYATPTIRFMANYVQSTVEYPGTTSSDDDIDAFQVRAQIDF